jgi:hypothetical protein
MIALSRRLTYNFGSKVLSTNGHLNIMNIVSKSINKTQNRVGLTLRLNYGFACKNQ